VSSTNSFTKGTCTAFSVQRINEQSFTCSQRLTSHEVLLLPVSRTRHRSNALFTDSSRRWVRESRAARGREPKIMHTGASCGLAASLHPKRKEHTYCASLCYFTLARTEIPILEAAFLLPVHGCSARRLRHLFPCPSHDHGTMGATRSQAIIFLLRDATGEFFYCSFYASRAR
jgi:hypothetical protein